LGGRLSSTVPRVKLLGSPLLIKVTHEVVLGWVRASQGRSESSKSFFWEWAGAIRCTALRGIVGTDGESFSTDRVVWKGG
jgi:hypothetical protein